MNKALMLIALCMNTDIMADEVIIQSGSFDGMLSSGYSSEIDENLYVDLLIGVTPDPSGTITSSTLKIKQLGFRGNGFGIGIGAKLIATADKDTYILLPKKYPRRYYPPTGIYFSPFISMHCELDDESSIYYEVSTLDYYMEAYVRNFESTSISEFITYGIGLAYKLD